MPLLGHCELCLGQCVKRWATVFVGGEKRKSSRKKQLATGYNAWVAIHNISASRRWRWQPGAPAQDVLHEAETWRQSHVQGPCCCGLDSESTNVHAYIDRAGWEGVWQRRRGRTLPQTTRVRKAINKQDTSRMSNINNKNESRCRTLHPFSHVSPPPSPLSPLASCHSEHSHEWCLNGNVWVAARAELSVARMSAYLCCAYWRHLRPPRPRTVSHLHSSLFLLSPPLNLAQIENIYVLCKANCVESTISKE